MPTPFRILFITLFLGLNSLQAAEQPNILWLSCEDISPHLGCYGDPHAITPNLDQLASEGVLYSHAFTAAGVCAPCRSTIITGMYQNSIGTHHMRCNAKLPNWLQPFPMYLKDAGYYCTNNSKTDYQFSDPGKNEIWDECSGKGHWRGRKDDQPFFAIFNFTGCHESGIASKSKYEQVTKDLTPEQRQDAAALTTFPPYYPDTAITREDWKRNYELITAMDAWAGDLIQQLKDDGLYDNTIIFYWSDHGVGLPRAKRWLYDSGTHIPLIVHIPEALRTGEQGKPGTIDSQLVNSTDFGPTVLNLAGLEVPDYMQGQAFLGPDLPEPRKYVYGARDRMDERYDIIRTVRDQRYRYIRNFEPLKPYYQYMNTPEKGATMQEIRRYENTMEKLPPVIALFSADKKPVEELYDLETDPHEINNLADNPDYAEKLQEFRGALSAWQKDVADIGLMPESEIERLEEDAPSRYEIMRGEDDAGMVSRLVDAATIASEGADKLAEMQKALKDENPSVRYWAATGIGNIGSPYANLAKEEVAAAMEDSSPAVRIAAARAVARLGDPEAALPVLEQALESPLEWARLEAAIVLDEMEEQARPALPALQAALENQPNKYIIRVSNRAVNDLLGTDNKVP